MYEPAELFDGSVLQAGIPTVEDGAAPPSYRSTYGYIARAVVLKTYFADDSGFSGTAWKPQHVFVDVRVYGTRSRTLYRVPVCQGMGSIWDEDVYVPRAARTNIGGGKLAIDGRPNGSKPTEAHNMDGDHVLLGFLECDPFQPIVFPFSLPHPATGRQLQEADGRVRRLRHAGTMIQWDENGDITIDATGAAQPELTAQGQEVSSSGSGGVVTIKTKDGAGAVSKLELDAAGGVAIEAAGGTCKLHLTKNADVAIDAQTAFNVSAGTTVEIEAGTSFKASGATTATMEAVGIATVKGPTVHLDGPLTQLSDVSTDPVLKGTAVIAAFTALFNAWAAALANSTPAPVDGNWIAYKSAMAPAIGAIQSTLALWPSLKVLTG